MTYKWDGPSQAWIDKLPQFAERLMPGLRRAVERTISHAYLEMTPKMLQFEFEGAMWRDLHIAKVERGDGWAMIGVLGFGEETVNDPDENVSAEVEGGFAIPRGKDTGITPHRVYLYNRAGESTPGRAKLLRYLKMVNPAQYGDAPDELTKEWFDKRPKDERKFKPYVDVAPKHNDFLSHLLDADGKGPLVEYCADRVTEEVGALWKKP